MDRKRIKILTSGVIPVKGFFCGPILTPHFETISNIYQLISAGVNVVEVLDNGSEIRLTMMNYNVDNNPHAYVNKKPVGITPVVFIEPETVSVPVVETEPTVAEVPEVNDIKEPEVDEQVKEDETPVIEPVVDEPEVSVVEHVVVTEEPEVSVVEHVVVTEEPEVSVVENVEEPKVDEHNEEETVEKAQDNSKEDTVVKTGVKVGTINNEKREGNNNNKKNKNRK